MCFIKFLIVFLELSILTYGWFCALQMGHIYENILKAIYIRPFKISYIHFWIVFMSILKVKVQKSQVLEEMC